MRVFLLSLLPAGAALAASASTARATPPPFPAVVARYVDQAFAANLGLDRERRDVDSARARLEAARGALGPRLDLAARYTVARGGRSIDFPAGDLLNPVYSTLNRLTGTDRFPTVENQLISFLRRHEQETKLRLLQPLYHPEIRRGFEATRERAAAAQAALAAFRRELRLEVQRAYFRWLQAGAAVDIYASAAGVVAEAVRVNRVLVAADAATEDAVLRLEAEAQLIEQQYLAAAADTALAAAHLNLLLDRPAAALLDPVAETDLDRLLRDLRAFAARSPHLVPQGREELIALDHAVQAAAAATRAARAARQPAVSLAVESGLQGESYRTGSGAGFTQASVVAEWNLFDGRRAASRVRVSANEQAQAEARRAEVRRRLELQAERVATLEQLQDARTAVEVAEAQLQVAEFNRRFATVEAPADGRILRRQAEPNELVTSGQPILGFGAKADGWVFRAGIAERDARPLAIGATATLVFQGPPEVTLAAALTQLAEAADPQTRTFEAEFAVAGVPANLRSGAIGTLRLVRTSATPLSLVPLGALLEGHGRRAFLFLLEADGRTVRRREVEIETLRGPTALLATPLAAGARVVSVGAEYLRDRETVAVADPR